MQTTPKKITKQIVRWAAELSKQKLRYVRVDPDGLAGFCFMNCAKRVEDLGGRIIQGWLIWEGSLILEAEHHSVWCNDQNRLVDVTPTFDGEKKILFLPDLDLKVKLKGKEVEVMKNLIFPSRGKKVISLESFRYPIFGEITDKLIVMDENSKDTIKRLYKDLAYGK